MKYLFILVSCLVSLAFSQSYIKDESGNQRSVKISKGQKFFISDKGDTVEIGKYKKAQVDKELAIYKNFSKRGFNKFNKLSKKETVSALITFSLPVSSTKELDQNTVNENYVYFTAKHLFAKYNIEGENVSGRTYKANLNKSQIQQLVGNQNISEIDIDDSTDVVTVPLQNFNDNFENVPSNDPAGQSSVNAYYFTSRGYTGQGVSVGQMEPAPMVSSHLANFFNYSLFHYRGGSSIASPTNHSANVSSLIHNNLDPAFNFQGGGAYNSELSVAYSTTGEGNMFNAYNWAISNYSTKIINHSYGMATNDNALINSHSRYLDITANNWPYVLNIMGAGNSGDLVAWNCHNCITVGNVWPTRQLYTTSSWRNRPNGDEQPHLTAVGTAMSFVTGTSVESGTSYSAPVITALAADATSLYSHYNSYPECLKAALMASAIGRHSDAMYDAYNETKSGFGVPNGEHLYNISANRYYSASAMNGTEGVVSFTFLSTATSGTSLDRTLTIPAVSGTKKLNIVLTFFSNPEGTCVAGNDCIYDDIDIIIRNASNGSLLGSSGSWKNTTEFMRVNHSAALTYNISTKLYSRVTNQSIYCAIAWRITDN